MCLYLSHGEQSLFHISSGIMAVVCAPFLMGTKELCLILGSGRGFTVIVVGANCVCTLSFHSHVSSSSLFPSGNYPPVRVSPYSECG